MATPSKPVKSFGRKQIAKQKRIVDHRRNAGHPQCADASSNSERLHPVRIHKPMRRHAEDDNRNSDKGTSSDTHIDEESENRCKMTSCKETSVDSYIPLGDSGTDEDEVPENWPGRRYFTTSRPQAFGLAKNGSVARGQIKLSKEQFKVLKSVVQGESVFMTGSAGTGKSFLLEHAIRLLKNQHGKRFVYVTASTGLAACALGGTTLHSFAGVGLGEGTKEVLAAEAYAKKDVRKRWMRAKVLVIDEISMITGKLFDKLEYVARRMKEGEFFETLDDVLKMVRVDKCRKRVFGGLQLLVTGDFFQLPPIKPKNLKKAFAFDAECWNNCFDLQTELKYVFRQRDSEFVQMLNEIRKGICSPQTAGVLKKCSKPEDNADHKLPPTKLFPLRVEVDKVNQFNLNTLGRKTIQFMAEDWAIDSFRRRQLDDVPAEKVLTLCVGAQVMLVKNLDSIKGLVNGAKGVVVGFVKDDPPDHADMKDSQSYQHFQPISETGEWPVVQFASIGQVRTMRPEDWSVSIGDKEVARRRQVPLMLAWALSIHKCQGMTLERVETDLTRAFDYGMVYVALSRVKSLDGLRLIGFDQAKIKAHPAVKKFHENLEKQNMVNRTQLEEQ